MLFMKSHLTLLAGILITTCSAPQLPVTVVPVVNEAPAKYKWYDWHGRHNEVVERVKKGDADLIMIGDSITHGWNADLWKKHYEPRKAVNMGFSSDGTQHVLWRLQNGEIDGISPKVAVVLIGVNNIGGATVEDTAKGVEAVVNTLQQKLPETKVLLLGIFPWKQSADAPERSTIKELNKTLSTFAKKDRVTFLDIGVNFLEKDGSLSAEIMPDYLHLSPKGYKIWADAMEPVLSELMSAPH